MIKGKSVLAIVPARSGSKGLIGKNIRELCGKSLIEWSIAAGLQSAIVDSVIVSTDCREIARVSSNCGADVPFIRPMELATDSASSIDVIEHACNFMACQGRHFDYVVLLEPTSPLREAADIDGAIQLMIGEQADAVVSICLAESHHPDFMFRMDSSERIIPFGGKSFRALRRQDLEPAYFLDGTIYASATKVLMKERTFCHSGTIGYVVPKWKSPEVDDILDFIQIEAIMKYRGIPQ